MNKELDWPRIAHLMKIGIAAALMVLVGDMLLGWGVHDAAKPGMEGFLSAYLNLSDGRIFWSALLGLIGIPLEALCYFAVYRLIAPYSSRLAHLYRSGILGVLAFGGCGVHVPCLACVFFYKYMMAASPETALDASVRFGLYFLLPGMILAVFPAARYDPVLHLLAGASDRAYRRLLQRPDALPEMVLDLLSGSGHGADHAAEAFPRNAASQRPDSRLDQHRKPVDVRRTAGHDEKGIGEINHAV